MIDDPSLAATIAERGYRAVVEEVRRAIDEARGRILGGDTARTEIPELAAQVVGRLRVDRRTLRPVLNLTGILLNTGLGRAPLAAEALDAIAEVARGYCNLEFDLVDGGRGHRTSGVAALLCEITGAEAAAVVNNNAGATILALRALANGREVVVSRGQLVEIGGSFRLPEIFEVSGARLREVGTTNKTRLADYERAIGPETAAILRVHPSNYRVVGFTEEVGIGDLVGLAHARGLSAIDDVGSGRLDESRPPIVGDEPSAAAGIRAGADLVLFSGDKLLGGPQCGVLVGTREAVAKVEADPLMRALRVDKLTLAALEATLRLARDPGLGAAKIPLWAALAVPVEVLRARAEGLAEAIRAGSGCAASAVETVAYLGGGSMPGREVPSAGVRIGPPFPAAAPSEAALAATLRRGDPAVVGRVQAGALWLDLRACPARDDPEIVAALHRAGQSF